MKKLHHHERPVGRWNHLRSRVLTTLSMGLSLAACHTSEDLSPTEKLAERFGDNFNPNQYGHFVDSAYEISEARDPDPASPIQCVGQEKTELDPPELIEYLIACKSRQRILEFLEAKRLDQEAPDEAPPATEAERSARIQALQANRKIKVDTITMEDIFDIHALLGRDPELYSAFMKSILTYRGWDMKPEDTFRHPIHTMRSGWTDCDDWAVEHYYWAHLHNCSPNLVIAVRPEASAVADGGIKTVKAHTFVNYSDPKIQRSIVLDNSRWQALAPGQTVEAYVEEAFPEEELTVEFNGPYIDKN